MDGVPIMKKAYFNLRHLRSSLNPHIPTGSALTILNNLIKWMSWKPNYLGLISTHVLLSLIK